MSAERVKKAIQDLAKRANSLEIIVGEVTEVDETRRVIDLKPHDGSAEVYDVRINTFEDNTKGLTIVPKKGSSAIVLMLNKDHGIVLMAEEIEKVIWDANEEFVFNGGNNDGFVLVKELTDKLNNLEKQHNKLLADFTSHIHGDPISGVTSSIMVPPTSTSIIITVKSDIENPKLRH